MALLKETAIWPGDSKWHVKSDGNLEPLSLKQLIVSYIAENLGSVSIISCFNDKVLFYRDGDPLFNADNSHNKSESRPGTVVKSPLDCQSLSVLDYSNGSNESLADSTVSAASCSGACMRESSTLGEAWEGDNTQLVMLPYSHFNIPNFGRMFDKSTSTAVPGFDKIKSTTFKKNFYNFEFRDSETYLSPHAASLLLSELDRCGILNDSVLSLFHRHRVVLYEVKIRKCGNVLTGRGISHLLQHPLVWFEVHNLQVPISNILQLVHPELLWNLKCLALPSFAHLKNSDVNKQLLDLIKLLPNLEQLDLSCCEFLTSATLHSALCLLPKLWRLNISQCCKINSIDPLLFADDRLQYLELAGVKAVNIDAANAVLLALKKLVYLDISTVASLPDNSSKCINKILVNPNFAPDLEYLDISNQHGVTLPVLEAFLQAHSNVRCVGVVNVPYCDDFDIAKYSQIKFLRDLDNSDQVGMAAKQLTDCLLHYRHCPLVLPILLQQTCSVVQTTNSPQPRLIAAILRVMESHQQHTKLQESSSFCLHMLTTGPRLPLHPTLLRSVVHATVHSMTRFPSNYSLQKNSLLLLCTETVLHDVSFNQYWVAGMALQALLQHRDESVDLMAVGICSILAAKLTNEQTAKLGSCPVFMRKLLTLVTERMQVENADITLQFTLSALWNLTDESPDTCKIFLEQDGMRQFLNLLQTFPNNAAVEAKVLGLFNNVAEVPELRSQLLTDPFIAMLRWQMQSSQIAVSYFAAGITAHLLCADFAKWKASGDLPYDDLMLELGAAVQRWESNIDEMVAYKSFFPFQPLLRESSKPFVQLWALWALHHVTSNNSKYYCPMLIREDIPRLLQGMYEESLKEAPCVSELASKLLKLVQEHVSSSSVTLSWSNRR